MKKFIVLVLTVILIIFSFAEIYANDSYNSGSISNSAGSYANISAGDSVNNSASDAIDGSDGDYNRIFKDMDMEAIYEEAVSRLFALGIVNGNGAGEFRPNDALTREEFAIIMVRASGLEDEAELLKGTTGFPDIDIGRYSSGYINAAVNKGYIGSMPDGTFNPYRPVTYAQVLTVIIRALGYSDGDLQGIWPANYIGKARSLGLVKDLQLNGNDSVPRWAATILINRLLDTDIKVASSSQQAKTFGEASEVCSNSECIILGNINTNINLKENQILTDKGIFYIDDVNYISSVNYISNVDYIDEDYLNNRVYLDDRVNLDLGKKYRLAIVNNKVVWASSLINEISKITVSSFVDNKIEYYQSNWMTGYMTLSENTVYYYHGAVQSIDKIQSILKQNSSIIFACNKDKDRYEYAVIFDPVYSRPEVKRDNEAKISSIGSIGSIHIDSGSIPVIKNGEVISIMNIKYGDVVYEATDVWGGHKYILVLEQKVFGNITGVMPNIMAANALELDGKAYDLSSSFNRNKLDGRKNSFVVGDSVIALLGINGEVVDILHPDNITAFEYAFVLNYSTLIPASDSSKGRTYTVKLFLEDGSKATYHTNVDPSGMKGKFVTYERISNQKISLEVQDNVSDNIKNNFITVPDFYTECIILGNSQTFDYLSENQVITDLGILYNISNEARLELGNKYRVAIDGDCILMVDGKMKSLDKVTVSSAIDTYISGKKEDKFIDMILPQKTAYYYNGIKQDYNNLKDILNSNSSIIFSYNDDKTGYEYGIIFDPVYSKPIVNRSGYTATVKAGSIELTGVDTIVKNDRIIERSDICSGDVVYEVADIWGRSRYVLVVDKKVKGVITAITPNILSPKYIQIDNINYQLDKNMDFSKIKGKSGFMKTGTRVTLLLGYNGKVVDIL